METTYETFMQYGALGAICVVLIINSLLDRKERQKDREERRAMWNELLAVARTGANGYSELSTFLREKFK